MVGRVRGQYARRAEIGHGVAQTKRRLVREIELRIESRKRESLLERRAVSESESQRARAIRERLGQAHTADGVPPREQEVVSRRASQRRENVQPLIASRGESHATWQEIRHVRLRILKVIWKLIRLEEISDFVRVRSATSQH